MTPRVGANLAFGTSQWAVAPLSLLVPGGVDIGARSAQNAAPTTPAGYAFGIWALIYAACLAYAIWQALPGNRDRPLLRRIGWASAGAFALDTAWVLAARFGPYWSTLAIILGVLACALAALVELTRSRRALSRSEYWFALVPLSLLAGWITIATFANAGSFYRTLAEGRVPVTAWSIAVLAAAVVAAAILVRRADGNPWYAGPIVWGLAAVAAANAGPAGNAVVAAAAGVGGAVVLVVAGLALRQARAGRVTQRQQA